MQEPEKVGMNFFAHKSTFGRQKFTGKKFAQKWPGFLLCLFDFQAQVNHSHSTFIIDK